MAAVLTEPEAAKAATTTAGDDMVHMSFPIEKSEDTKTVNPVDGTPDIEIWGKATDGTIDSDLQVVDPAWSLPAIKTWFATKANVRFQHDPKRPVGKGIDVDGHYVRAMIADPMAKHFIRTGVLNDFSVGIMNPDIRRGDPAFKHLDPQGKAINGVITGRPDGISAIGEISVVDRGSNFGTKFSLVKAAADGTAEWAGELTAPDEVLAKAAAPAKSKTVTVELPKNMSLSIKPSDLAKLATFKQKLTTEKVTAPGMVTKVAEPDADLDVLKAAEAAVYKRDIDTATRRRLAGEGRALSNLSYPIETHEDAHNAATLALSGHGDVGAAKNLIRRVSRKEGWKDVLDRLKGGKKKDKVAKAAKPDTTKCMKCDGSGMMDGQPCPDCKKGKKKAAKTAKAEKRAVREALAEPAAVKKKKVMCPNCGAKQNPKHVHCPECGKPLPRMMPAVVKNHDFACLGCGKDPLDKGEKHCPDCGKENPGYLPEADHKIPANKAAEERVTKKRKAKGKNPFGDKQAPPFGAKDDTDAKDAKDGEDAKKPPKAAKKAAVTKRKGKGKGRSPAAGVAGHDGDTMGLPAHREPDGPAIEEFEKSTNLEDGDESQEMAAAMRHKTLEAAGLSRDHALLHDLTCPAFDLAAVAKAFPYASLGTIDADAWQAKALSSAAEAPLDKAAEAQVLWQHAVTLKNTDPEVAHDLRAEQHHAFRKANKTALKAFRDAAPGPGSFPTPGHVTPSQFQRPYISAGHGSESPQAQGPHSFAVPEGQPSAEDYTRGHLTEGHAADSPQNDTPRHEPQPAPMTPGKPDRVYYRGTMRDNARQAMTAMHDHISRVFPDVCPMSPEITGIQKPAPAVPEGVGAPAPHKAGKAARKAAKAKARKKAKAQVAKRRRYEQKVLKGDMTVTKARRKLGLKPPVTKGGKAKAAKATAPPVDPEAFKAGVASAADAIKAAVAEATAPLLERQARQEKVIRKQRKAITAIAGQPDTSQAPLRGVAAINKTSAPPAGAPLAAQSRDLAQAADLLRLQHTWRNSSDPVAREAAYRDLTTQLGLNTMTSPQT